MSASILVSSPTRARLEAAWDRSDGLVRRSFRSWFQPHYPHVFAQFRPVSR